MRLRVSLFFIASEDLRNALEESVEVLNRGRWFWPEYASIPFDSTWFLMEFTSAYELRELSMKWTRNFPGKPPEDHALCTFHLLNRTAGLPDATWTTADYTTAEGLFDAYWTAIKDRYPAFGPVLAEYQWRPDGPAFKPFGASLQPTLRTTARSVAGTSTGDAMLPPQAAITVTEVIPSTFTVEDVEGVGTQVRNRWGRFYLPAPGSTSLADGRIAAATLTDIADATKTLYDGLVAADLLPVVYSPTTGHAWSVAEVHVDDVWDVIRSRRYRNTLARTPRTITPA